MNRLHWYIEDSDDQQYFLSLFFMQLYNNVIIVKYHFNCNDEFKFNTM